MTIDSSETEIIYSSPPERIVSLVVASWAVILAIVVGICLLVTAGQYWVPRQKSISGAELMSVNMLAKSLVGFKMAEQSAIQQIDSLKEGPIEQRLAHVFLVNEVAGAEKAAIQLEEVELAVHDFQKANGMDDEEEPSFPNKSQKQLQELTRKLISAYQDEEYDTSNITDEERILLDKSLGWVGELALTPKESPDTSARQTVEDEGKRVVMLMMVGGVLFFLVLASSLVALFIFGGLLMNQHLSLQLKNKTEHGFVYIETFALWIAMFMGLQLMIGLFGGLFGRPSTSIVLSPLAFFGSLLALAWPIQRGLSWKTLRSDLGLEIRNPFIEIMAGGSAYIALIIPILMGIITSAGIGGLIDATATPSEFESVAPAGHPIMDEITAGGPLMYIMIGLSACVCAPIVEEIMFRGVLYRYLRDATGHMSARWMSVIASAFFGGLIFAAVHPQGIIGIPVLTVLAMGFAIVREWRNSLIAPMFMHAIHNGAVTCFILLMIG